MQSDTHNKQPKGEKKCPGIEFELIQNCDELTKKAILFCSQLPLNKNHLSLMKAIGGAGRGDLLTCCNRLKVRLLTENNKDT